MAAKKKTRATKVPAKSAYKITKLYVVFEDATCTKILACSPDIEKLREKYEGVVVKVFRVSPGRAVKF